MDEFLSRKRQRLSPKDEEVKSNQESSDTSTEDSTDIKLAILLSLFPAAKQDGLLDILVSCEGSVEAASSVLSLQGSATDAPKTKNRAAAGSLGMQTSLSSHVLTTSEDGIMRPMNKTGSKRKLPPTKNGKTLHLYSPEDIAAYTPCTIIHNFLPSEEANKLLLELLDESKYLTRSEFQLFDRTVQSPHTHAVFVSTPEELRQQTSEYTYGGTYRSNVRQAPPQLRSVSRRVQTTVNDEIQKRIREVYPDGKKLQYQSSKEWKPNAAFVNCYDGPSESVGYHSDHLTYLGPHPVIGSLSLGVAREFRIRRIVAQDDEAEEQNEVKNYNSVQSQAASARADAQGQISIHLPHNSLLIMHAEMQEEWKHSIAPAQTISPHPISGNRRINVTYRWYRDTLHPRYIPRCQCGEHTILRCAQRKQETRGRYMWMCYASFIPGKEGCSFFQWAEFDDDGDPVWEKKIFEDQAPELGNFSASQ